MVRLVTSAVAGALSLAATVVAHGHVSGWIIDGVYYRGYESDSDPYNSNPPITAGWTTDDKDNGFVQPVAFNTSDIICHRSATPAKAHIAVKAGDTIAIEWNTWPDSHVGPITDMLANCNGPCESVDKTTLRFFPIARSAWISGADPGYWEPNVMIANNFSWNVVIPSSIAPGNYVLRHEIIALHASQSANGAQAYPQCISLQITGSGTLSPTGVNAVGMYNENDPGIIYNIYQSPLPSYTIPGPALGNGFPSTVSQYKSAATATGTAVSTYASGGSSPPPSSSAAGSSAATTTTTTTTTTTKSSAAPPSSTTKATTTTTTTSAAPAGSSVALYQQCGGIGYSGSTTCVSGAKCSVINSYYSQCVPA